MAKFMRTQTLYANCSRQSSLHLPLKGRQEHRSEANKRRICQSGEFQAALVYQDLARRRLKLSLRHFLEPEDESASRYAFSFHSSSRFQFSGLDGSQITAHQPALSYLECPASSCS